MDYPLYAEVNGKRYPINTDFRVAIECNRIAEDNTIKNTERALGIICTLFGEDAIDDTENYEKLLEIATRYLRCGQDDDGSSEKPDMDFIEDYAYIKTSFRSDYGIKLDDEHMHWWEFMDLMNGLSNSDVGNCCILNRIRNLRNYDTRDIKDQKEKDKIEKAKKQVALKRNKKKVNMTEKQRQSAVEIYTALGFGKE